jgi:hypothetical protein
LLRLLIVLCLSLPLSALADEEPTPSSEEEDADKGGTEDPPVGFPAPEAAPSFPAPEAAPSFPAPEAAPSFPAPETAPSFPAPEAAPSFPAPEAAPSFPAPEAAPSFPSPEAAPSFPAPEAAPSFPAPAGGSAGGFPAPAGALSGFPAPEGGLSGFPSPEGGVLDDDDSAAGGLTPPPTPTPAPTPYRVPRGLAPDIIETFKATQQLSHRIEQAEMQLTNLAFQRMSAASERRRTEIDEEVAAVKSDAETMRRSLRKLAGGVDTSELNAEPEEDVSWEDELAELVAPVLQEVKRATERPRETERLRIRSAHFTQKLEQLEAAIESVQALMADADDPLHKAELELYLGELHDSKAGLSDEFEVAQGALHALELETGGFFSALSQVFTIFFADRGRNILSALFSFLLVLVLMMVGRHFLIRALGVETGRKATLWFRVIDLSVLLSAVVVSSFSGLAVLFVSGDWVLLTVAAVLLFGVFWGARESIPQYWDEVRLLLNVGPVREGERVMYDDLPWLVESLHFVTILRNPAFPGVYIRLPLAALEEMVSRPFLAEEPWFPTAVGDFVDMGDDGWGHVTFQSPEVVLARIQGILRTYSATDWFSEPPPNLSSGWRTDVLLTLDYRHQKDITNAIPELLQEFLRRKYASFPLSEHLQSLTVGFEQMGDSTLDLEISGWFDGAGAALWESAEEDLAALCVEACNEFGWTIAFPQMTIGKRDA